MINYTWSLNIKFLETFVVKMDETSQPSRFTLAELEHAIAMKFRPWMSKVDAEIRSLKESNKDLLEEVNILKARCKSLKLSAVSKKQVDTPIYTAADHTRVCQEYAYQCSCENLDYREPEHEPECYSSYSIQCVCPNRYYLRSEHDQSCQSRVQGCVCNVAHFPTNNYSGVVPTSDFYPNPIFESISCDPCPVYDAGIYQTQKQMHLQEQKQEEENTDNETDISSSSDEEPQSSGPRWWSWFV